MPIQLTNYNIHETEFWITIIVHGKGDEKVGEGEEKEKGENREGMKERHHSANIKNKRLEGQRNQQLLIMQNLIEA